MDLSLRALLDVEPDLIAWSNLDGKLLFINASAAKKFGKPADELINISIWDVYPEPFKSHHQILMNQVIKTGHPIRVKNKDHDSWLETSLFPIIGADKNVESVVFIIKEISSLIDTERRLKQVLSQLINAQEDERYRISRDLHDEIGQRMTSLILQLRVIKDSINNEKSLSTDEINKCIGNLELINKQVRQVYYQLYPPSLNRMPLPKVVEAFCISIGEANNLKVNFNCQENFQDLSETQNLMIYRFFQEGMNNVIKHAMATAVWINLDCSDGGIYLSLEDNGRGFDQKNVKYGVGLLGIGDRLAVLNGDLKIDTTPGKGTRLSGYIPLSAKVTK